MGSTPRRHRYQVPMSTRSTDVDSLAQCPGSWLLRLIHEKDQMPASYFILGDKVHQTIEVSIQLDLDLDWATRHLTAALEREIERVDGLPVLESSRRGMDTIIEDGQRMIANWFRFTHPDSPKRAPIYNEYQWPPETEVEWHNMGIRYPTWGSTDAIFTSKDGESKAIVDWKTSASAQKGYDQLHFYRYGLGLPEARAWFHNVDRVQLRAVIQEAPEYCGDDAVLARIEFAESTKDRILDTGRVSFTPDWYCNFCPVRDACPKEGPNPRQALDDLTRAMPLLRPLEEVIEAA